MAALYVFLGGGLGSLCRYGISVWLAQHSLRVPAATMLANVLAGLILGFIVEWALRHDGQPYAVLFIGVGFCGGFSTFSTFSLENVQLWQQGEYLALLANVILSVTLCFGSVIIGLRIAQMINA